MCSVIPVTEQNSYIRKHIQHMPRKWSVKKNKSILLFYLVTDRGAGIIFVSICKEGKANKILKCTFALAIYILAYVKSALWNYAMHSLYLCKRNEYWLRSEGICFHCSFCSEYLKKIYIKNLFRYIFYE